MKMHLFASSLVVGLGLAQAAMAADMPLKAPLAPPPPPSCTWCGLYIGGNVGRSSSDASSGSAHLLNAAGVEQMQTAFSLAPSGWTGGGQIGYNLQFAHYFVLAGEWDWQRTNQSDSACGIAGMACINTPSPNGASFMTQSLSWISTARVRLGFTEGEWLFYATGGGAWGKVDTSLSVNCPRGCGNLGGPSVGAGAFSDNLSGSVYGAGIEVMLLPRLSARAEYLRVNLGSISHAISTTPVQTTVAATDHVTDNIFRLGLNWTLWGGI